MGRYFKGTEKFRRSSAGCVGKQETQVAEGIRLAHFETSQLQYNDENALSYTISLALYAARNFTRFTVNCLGEKGLRILFSYQEKDTRTNRRWL